MSIGAKFAERLKFARLRRGLSQDQLAESLSVSRGAVGNWETGQTPNLGTVEQIAEMFGVSVAWLLGHTEGDVLRDAPATPYGSAPGQARPLNPLDEFTDAELSAKAKSLMAQGEFARAKAFVDELASRIERGVSSRGAEAAVDAALEIAIDAARVAPAARPLGPASPAKRSTSRRETKP